MKASGDLIVKVSATVTIHIDSAKINDDGLKSVANLVPRILLKQMRHEINKLIAK